ncbi:MAG: hypothetical protein M1820_006931 [Bogoriella megaspora]|nr:MAG: hypothetical protein M1820_006931 [Bogoriella megaspora]
MLHCDHETGTEVLGGSGFDTATQLQARPATSGIDKLETMVNTEEEAWLKPRRRMHFSLPTEAADLVKDIASAAPRESALNSERPMGLFWLQESFHLLRD